MCLSTPLYVRKYCRDLGDTIMETGSTKGLPYRENPRVFLGSARRERESSSKVAKEKCSWDP